MDVAGSKRELIDRISLGFAARAYALAALKYDVTDPEYRWAESRLELFEFKVATWDCDIDLLARQLQEE